MPNQLEVYKCTHCGNIVEVIHGGGASLVCCGENMKLMKEGSTDGAMEKHVPVIEKIEGGYKVTVGSVAHPMDENHYIEWIELLADHEIRLQRVRLRIRSRRKRQRALRPAA